MFNKIYEKIKKIIIKNYKEILIYILIFLFLTFPLPYYIYIGGGIIDLDKRISLESNEKGSYNLAYVKQINATIPTYLLSLVIDSWTLDNISNSSIDSKESVKEISERERIYLEEANNHAILNAYRLANREIIIKSSNYKVIYVSSESKTDIKIGDIILSVNGISISNNQEYKEYLKSLEIDDNLKVKVIRDDKEIDCYAKLKEIAGEKIIGLYMANIYDFEVEPEIELYFNKNESGPSGGFMLSLAIYDRLVDIDLTKGRKIVGTGTIDSDGNIGEIGGVSYKLMGAVSNKADIFFVPTLNYEEAIETKEKYNYDIDIVQVATLSDAIKYLEEN